MLFRSCDECGYVESQHDEVGRCPSYEYVMGKLTSAIIILQVFMVFPVMAVITVGILFAFMLGGGA